MDFDDILNEITSGDIATEGTNLEAFKTRFSPTMKEAKAKIKAGKKLFKDGKYDDAKKEYRAAKKLLGEAKIHILALPENAFVNAIPYIVGFLYSAALAIATSIMLGLAFSPSKQHFNKAVPETTKELLKVAVGITGANILIQWADNDIIKKSDDIELADYKDIKNITKKQTLIIINDLIKNIDTLVNDIKTAKPKNAVQAKESFSEISTTDLKMFIIYECMLDGMSEQIMDIADDM